MEGIQYMYMCALHPYLFEKNNNCKAIHMNFLIREKRQSIKTGDSTAR